MTGDFKQKKKLCLAICSLC